MIFLGFLMASLIVLKSFHGSAAVENIVRTYAVGILESNVIFHKFYDGYCCWYKSLEMFHKSLLIRSFWVQSS